MQSLVTASFATQNRRTSMFHNVSTPSPVQKIVAASGSSICHRDAAVGVTVTVYCVGSFEYDAVSQLTEAGPATGTEVDRVGLVSPATQSPAVPCSGS